MNDFLTPDYITAVASTIMDQIKATTPWSVRGSWGAHNWQATIHRDMAALAFKVSGLIHKGSVYVAYNEGYDTYEIFLYNSRGALKKHIEDVYCDNLGHILDVEIERGTMPEDDYQREALADSAKKIGAEII